MKTTADYIDALRVKLNVDSDFKAMNALGVKHRQQVSEWRKLHSAFGEDLCYKVADTLEIDRAEVVLAMKVQQATNDEARKLWERIANMAVAASVLLVIGGVSIGGLSSESMPYLLAGFTAPSSGGLYIMTNAEYVLYWGSFLALFLAWLWAYPRKNQPKNDKDNLSA